MKPDEFWRLTHAEFIAMLKGHRKRERRHTNEMLYLAWHAAMLGRMKDPPRLAELLVDEDDTPKRKEQTAEEMMAYAKLLTAAFGGEIVEVYD